MKVSIISLCYDPAGVGQMLCNSINDLTKHSCTHLLPTGNAIVERDAAVNRINIFVANTKDIKEEVDNADILHINQITPFQHKEAGPAIKRFGNWDQILKKKPWVFHNHGGAFLINPDKFMDNIKKYDPILLMCSPLNTKLFENSYWLPNIMPIDDSLYKPIKRKYDGTMKICHKIWYPTTKMYKGTEVLEEVTELLMKDKFNIHFKVFHSMNIDVCLTKSAEYHVCIENLTQGFIGMSGWESMAKGQVVIARLDPIVEEAYTKLGNGERPPIINVTGMDEMAKVIRELDQDRNKLQELCEASRQWIEKYYHPKKIIQMYIDFYSKVINKNFDNALDIANGKKSIEYSREEPVGVDPIKFKYSQPIEFATIPDAKIEEMKKNIKAEFGIPKEILEMEDKSGPKYNFEALPHKDPATKLDGLMGSSMYNTFEIEMIDKYFKEVGLIHNRDFIDMGCFPKGTSILKNNLTNSTIELINEGDYIITHTGNSRKVLKKFKRRYNGNLYNIKTLYKYKLKTTEEHPILAISKESLMCKKRTNRICNTNNNGKCSVCNNSKYDDPKWINAKELKKGDYIALPKNFNFNNLNDREKDITFAKFLGWYLAEGNIMYSHKPHIGGINITVGVKRNGKYVEEIKKMALKLGATSVTIRDRFENGSYEINCFGKDFAEKIYKYGGQYAHLKKLHIKVFSWTKEEKIAMLQTYFKGDGHHRYAKNSGELYSVKTVSKELSHQIRLIFNSFGICPSLSIEKRDIHKDCYNIQLNGKDIKILTKLIKDYPSAKRYRVSKDYIFIPIIQILKEKVDIDVYNMEVDKDNSYIANNICVHNCGVGRLTPTILKSKPKSYTGLDFSKSMIEEFSKNYPALRAHHQDLSNLYELKDKSFDTAFIMYIFIHIVDEEKLKKAVEEIKRVTKHYIIIGHDMTIPIEFQKKIAQNICRYVPREKLEKLFHPWKVKYWHPRYYQLYSPYDNDLDSEISFIVFENPNKEAPLPREFPQDTKVKK